MFIPDQELKKIIVGSSVVTDEQYEKALEEAQRTAKMVPEVLIGRGDLLESFYVELLSQYFEIPTIDLKAELLPVEVLENLPENLAKSRGAIIFRKSDKAAHLAMLDPNDLEIIEFIRAKTQLPVATHLMAPTDFRYALKRYKRSIGIEFKQIIEENLSLAVRAGKDIQRAAQDLPVIAILDTISEYAVAHGASDIHIESFEEKVIVRFRVEGVLHDIISLPPGVHQALVARVKILSGLAIDIHNAPQDGRYKFRTEDVVMSMRVSVMPTLYGEKVVIRLLPSSTRPLSLSELGLSAKYAALLLELIQRTYGIILVTGPTGSGKTTTLYSVLHILNKPEVNIVTVEDPIEYDIPRVSQTQINSKVGLTFAEGIRSFMRQNPDIMMVGEIRDRETAGMAVNAAMTGHLVFSTLHTNDAATAIPRLIDMKVETFLLSSTVSAVIAQRLVRKNCSRCIKSVSVPPELNKIIEKQLKLAGGKTQIKPIKNQYQGAGCEMCGLSGYKGQTAMFEILNVTSEMRQLILREAPAEELKKLAITQGMITLLEDGLLKVEQGTTTIEEVLRAFRE